jgi:predicted RNA binding protein YcfA (HicA-like mRNA interferase family)
MTARIKPTPYQVQVRIFESAGCVYVRTQGDHLIYHYPGAKRPVVIPKYKDSCIHNQKQHEGYWHVCRGVYLDLEQSLNRGDLHVGR